MLAADGALERDDALEKLALSNARPLGRVRVPRRQHDVHVNIPVTRVPERRDREAAFTLNPAYQREQLRYAAAWYDDVVVQLDGGDLSQRRRQLPSQVPDFVALLL